MSPPGNLAESVYDSDDAFRPQSLLSNSNQAESLIQLPPVEEELISLTHPRPRTAAAAPTLENAHDSLGQQVLRTVYAISTLRESKKKYASLRNKTSLLAISATLCSTLERPVKAT
eukprot:IDg14395t1